MEITMIILFIIMSIHFAILFKAELEEGKNFWPYMFYFFSSIGLAISAIMLIIKHISISFH